jgi:hypothetical protein
MPQGDRSEPVTTGAAAASPSDAQSSEARLTELWEEFKWHIAEYAALQERETALEPAYPPRAEFATEAEWEAAVTVFRSARGFRSVEDAREAVLRPIDRVRVAVAEIPASTVSSLRIKARVACWDPPSGFTHDDPDERVLRSLLDDLLREDDATSLYAPKPAPGSTGL